MAQLRFLEAEKRLAGLSEQGDPLEAVPWEEFRGEIEAVVPTVHGGRRASPADECARDVPHARCAAALQSVGRAGRYQARDRLRAFSGTRHRQNDFTANRL
jgi:hypothetical protein